MYRAAGYLRGVNGPVGQYVNLAQFAHVPGFGLGATTVAPQQPYEGLIRFAAVLAAQNPTERRLAGVVSALGNVTPAHLGLAEQLACALVRDMRAGGDQLELVRKTVGLSEKQMSLQETQLRNLLAVIGALDPTRTANFEASALAMLKMGSTSSAVTKAATNALKVAIDAVRTGKVSAGRAAQVALSSAQPALFAVKQPLVLSGGYRCAYDPAPPPPAPTAQPAPLPVGPTAQPAPAPPVNVWLDANGNTVYAPPAPTAPPVPDATMTETLTEQGTVLAPSSVADMSLEQLLAPQAPPPPPPLPALTEQEWVPPGEMAPLVLPRTEAIFPDGQWSPPDQPQLDLPVAIQEEKKFPVVPVALATGGVIAAYLIYRKMQS